MTNHLGLKLLSILQIVIFLIPALGIFGQTIAASCTLFFALTILYLLRTGTIQFDFSSYKLEMLFLFWIFISCFWSINVLASVIGFLKIAVIVVVFTLIIVNSQQFDIGSSNLLSILLCAIIVALSIFYIEYFTHGTITRSFRALMLNYNLSGKDPHYFYMNLLDKGCAFIVILSWVVIYLLLKMHKPMHAILFYCVIIFTMHWSDSLSSFVALAISGIVFFLMRYVVLLRKPLTACIVVITGSVAMLVFFYYMDPVYISLEMNFEQLSIPHRLFIWHFTATKAIHNFVFGYGFAASKFFQVATSEIIHFQGEELCPLPMHPHNNILQIWFENGAIGLVLYLGLCCKYLYYIGNKYNILNVENLNLIASKYAFFAAYFIISMMAYSIWQSWWFAASLFSVILFRFAENAK